MKKYLIWVFIIFLFAQFLLKKIIGSEPFPSIIFPSFADIPAVNGTIETTVYEIWAYSKTDSTKIKLEDYFPQMPVVYKARSLSHLFDYSGEDHLNKDTSLSSSNVYLVNQPFAEKKYLDFFKWVDSNSLLKSSKIKKIKINKINISTKLGTGEKREYTDSKILLRK